MTGVQENLIHRRTLNAVPYSESSEVEFDVWLAQTNISAFPDLEVPFSYQFNRPHEAGTERENKMGFKINTEMEIATGNTMKLAHDSLQSGGLQCLRRLLDSFITEGRQT